MHINHCLSTAKAIPIQEVQKLLCVDAAAYDAEYLCMWCLAILVDIFWEFLFKNLWNNSARLKQFTKQGFNNQQTIEKNLYSYHRNPLQFGNVGQELSLLVIKLTTLRRKLTQWFITFESHSFSSSGFLHVWWVHTCTWQWRHGKWNASSTKITEFSIGI